MADFVDPTGDVRLLSITRNQDLSEWTFCCSDQKSLCKNIVESGLSVMNFCYRHDLAISTTKRYMKKYRMWKTTGTDTFHDSKGGRPPKVDLYV
jgi:hypothetical protein